MNTYDFVQLSLNALGGKIEGKTKFQKMVYFLGEMTGELENLGYRAHFYGPYSDEVAESISRLKILGFIDQTVATAGSINSSGFEVARYDFKLNEQGQEIAKEKATRYRDVWEKINQSVEKIKKSGNIDYIKLSIAAKIFFMLKEKKESMSSIEELKEMAKQFKWSISDDQIIEAAKFLQTIGLVQLTV
jgi:uncharacterized protein YwgA